MSIFLAFSARSGTWTAWIMLELDINLGILIDWKINRIKWKYVLLPLMAGVLILLWVLILLFYFRKKSKDENKWEMLIFKLNFQNPQSYHLKLPKIAVFLSLLAAPLILPSFSRIIIDIFMIKNGIVSFYVLDEYKRTVILAYGGFKLFWIKRKYFSEITKEYSISKKLEYFNKKIIFIRQKCLMVDICKLIYLIVGMKCW